MNYKIWKRKKKFLEVGSSWMLQKLQFRQKSTEFSLGCPMFCKKQQAKYPKRCPKSLWDSLGGISKLIEKKCKLKENYLPVLQTSASTKYCRGSENENIGNIGENIGKCRKHEKQCCKNENIADPDFEDNITNIEILSRYW